MHHDRNRTSPVAGITPWAGVPALTAQAPVYVPIASLSPLEKTVDIRTGRIGGHDPVQGHFRNNDSYWVSLTSVLTAVANALDSAPPWITVMPREAEWEATHEDPDFPGALTWFE